MKITGKPGRSNKIHIFLDDEYTATTTEGFWATSGIINGSEISESKWQELKEAIYVSKIKNRALDLLSIREHSRWELSDKLYQKFSKDSTDLSYLKEQISAVCDTLEEQNILSDERFASIYAEELLRRKHASETFIKATLSKKGVSKQIISEVLTDMEINPVESIIYLLSKKYTKDDLKDEVKTNKVFDSFLRKGFSYSDIREAIYEYTSE